MADAKKRIPKRRFKEFRDGEEWEEREVRKVANRYDNLRVPITASDRIIGSTPYYGANGIQGYVEGFTHDGEFILVAEDGANDLKNYPVQYVNGKIWVNNHAHVLQAKEEVSDNKFLQYVISRSNIEPYLVGGGRAKLNAEIMMGINIKLPDNLKEQAKIGQHFQTLDTLITLHQRKLDKIKSTKKAYLSEMFPAEGETKPKRRFKGFSGEWEVRKLRESYKFSQGLQVSVNEQFNNCLNGFERFIRIVDVTQSSEPQRYIQNISGKGRVNNEDIFFVRYGAVGTVGYGYSGTIANNLFILTPLIKVNSQFMFQQFSATEFNTKLTEMSASTSMPAINFGALNNMMFWYPTLDEQVKIGSFFKTLDTLITLHQQKLDKLKNLKKSYLNEMFI